MELRQKQLASPEWIAENNIVESSESCPNSGVHEMDISENDFTDPKNWELNRQRFEYWPKRRDSVPCCIVPLGVDRFQPILRDEIYGQVFGSLREAAVSAWQAIQELKELAYQNQPEASVTVLRTVS